MVRRNEDQAVAGSSILLLQERFKQLQKLKEMRQERQLLQLLPQPGCVNDQEAAGLQLQDPLALGLNSKTSYNTKWNQIQHQPCNQMLTQQQQFIPAAAASVRRAYNFFEKVDVDTSLRL